ncbi:MAG: hypothetical protein JJLCMIEE_00347 [Acidimicrobiales bacterium]|nr:hypothetical protein [Acidimicrobiales bacterium]
MLSGGGNLGALQVGMLRALAERHVVPDLVLGCSVGALNGVAFAAEPELSGVRRLEALWLSITSDSLMPSSWLPATFQLARKGESLHGNEGLVETINRILEVQRFEELTVPFQCVATDLDSATESWFDEGELLPALLASAALPAVYPVVHIDGRRYMDGAIVNDIPLSRAVALGARRIYVLHVGQSGRPRGEIKRPLDAAVIAYWIARQSRLARDLSAVPRNTEVLVLPPGERPQIRYDDFSHTQELMTHGYLSTSRYLDARVGHHRALPGEHDLGESA